MQQEKILQIWNSAFEGITFSLDKNIDPCQILQLYDHVSWLDGAETEESITKMFLNSYAVASAYDKETGKLIGFFRALSDGVGDAYMVDLLVHPSYRKKGIGKALVKLLSTLLKEQGITWIVCIGVPGTEKFYCDCNGKVMADHIPLRFFGEE